MQKIETMYQRDFSNPPFNPITDTVKPTSAWVEAGEGVATRKMDGTNVKIEGGKLLKRRKPKDGNYTNASYVPCSEKDGNDRYLLQGFVALSDKSDGIYEAVGPKIQGNPEKQEAHALIPVLPYDASLVLDGVPRTFAGLREYLEANDMEGIVFHHPDGRLAKIKKKDFGLKRQKPNTQNA